MEEEIIKEKQFVQEARSGDLNSFSALVEMYQERAIHIAYSFIGNYEDARDLAQEAFVKAYENLQGFREGSRFYTWFYRILVNVCKDFLRKRKIRQQISFWFGADDPMGDLDPGANVPTLTKNASEVAINRELGEEIIAALEKLPVQQKSAFTLRYLEGMSIDEIAQCMQLSSGAIKATLWQASQKMKKFLSTIKESGG